MANTTTCMICGSKYEYCPNCARTHSWNFYADTRKHYQIYMILDELNRKVINIKEAKAMFANIGIVHDTDLSNIKPNVAKQIRKIVNYTEPKITKKKTENEKNNGAVTKINCS